METYQFFDVETGNIKSLYCNNVRFSIFATKEELELFLIFHPHANYIICGENPYKVAFAQYELPYWNGYSKTTKWSYSSSGFSSNKNYEDEYSLYLMKKRLIEDKNEIEEKLKRIEELETKLNIK